MKTKETKMAKERAAFRDLLFGRIEAKGVTNEQASINLGKSYAYLDMVFIQGNPTLATLLMIEKELGVEIFKWDKPIKNKDKELKKVFVDHKKKKR